MTSRCSWRCSMAITDTGVAKCGACQHSVYYIDVYSGGQAWTQFTDERGNEVKDCPACGHNLYHVGYSVKSDKPVPAHANWYG